MKAIQIYKPGYLYVLVHPSNPNLYKIGVTVLQPEKRLAQHNNQHNKYAGKIVKESGQKWELKAHISVPDPYWAESAFWGATHFPEIPYRKGIEIEIMTWDLVQIGLEAAKQAGVRPTPASYPDYVYAYTASVQKRLEGRGISLLGYVRSMVSGRSDFRCENGHEWHTTPKLVADGEGCPICGIGTQSLTEIRERIKAGVIFLLTHEGRPGYFKIGLHLGAIENAFQNWPFGDWQCHRYRNVEEVELAITVIWELLGLPLPHDQEAFMMDKKEAEKAFRDLTYVIQERTAATGRVKEKPNDSNR